MFSLSLQTGEVRSLLNKCIKVSTCPRLGLGRSLSTAVCQKPLNNLQNTKLLWWQKIHITIKQGFCTWLCKLELDQLSQTHGTASPLHVLSAPCNYICCPLAYSGSIYLPMWPSRDLLLMFQGFAHPQPSRTYLRSALFLSCCAGSREHGWLRAVIKQLLPPARCRLGKAQFWLHKAEFVRCECLWLQG